MSIIDRVKRYLGRVGNIDYNERDVVSVDADLRSAYEATVNDLQRQVRDLLLLKENAARCRTVERDQEALGPRYQFSEIPVEEAPEVLAVLRKYFNSERFKLVVRGQHLRKDGVDERRRKLQAGTYAVKDCTHVRVYIDERVGG